MDPLNKPSGTENDSDAYVGLLLYKTGASIKRLFVGIGRIFYVLGKAIADFVMFLFRNLLWLVLGTLIGLGYGAYRISKEGNKFASELTIKTNFNSSRTLYSTIEYLNALIGGQNLQELSGLFKITKGEARQLVSFTTAPVKSEMITAGMYRDQFIQYDRTFRSKQDTFWLHTVTYDDFKENLTNYDYPYHQVTAISTNPLVFPKLQTGLIAYVSNNKLLQETKQRQVLSNKEEETLLAASIKTIDTLRKAYSTRIASGQLPSTVPGNQITMMDHAPETKIPELEVYDKMLELQDELKKSRKRSLTENEIVEVISSFVPVGRQLSIFQQNTARYAVIGFIFSFLIITGITSLKYYRNPKKDAKLKI